MLYVSSVDCERPVYGWNERYYDKIGVTNTLDGKEYFYTNSQLYELLKTQNYKVYGTYCYGKDRYNMFVFAFPQKFNVKLSGSKLRELLDTHKKQHNPWSEYPIADYLASVAIGATIKIDYTDYGSANQLFRGMMYLCKIGEDLWRHQDDNSFFGNDDVDSYTAAHLLDYPWCGTRSHSLSISV